MKFPYDRNFFQPFRKMQSQKRNVSKITARNECHLRNTRELSDIMLALLHSIREIFSIDPHTDRGAKSWIYDRPLPTWKKQHRRTKVTAITEGEVSTRTPLKRLRKQVHMRVATTRLPRFAITVIISETQHCNLSFFHYIWPIFVHENIVAVEFVMRFGCIRQ